MMAEWQVRFLSELCNSSVNNLFAVNHTSC